MRWPWRKPKPETDCEYMIRVESEGWQKAAAEAKRLRESLKQLLEENRVLKEELKRRSDDT